MYRLLLIVFFLNFWFEQNGKGKRIVLCKKISFFFLVHIVFLTMILQCKYYVISKMKGLKVLLIFRCNKSGKTKEILH